MLSTRTLKLLFILALMLGTASYTHAQTKVNSGNQILWPPCTAGEPYVPYGNTCGTSLDIQMGFNEVGTGQFVNVPFTVATCTVTGGACNATPGGFTPYSLANGGFTISGGQVGTFTASAPVLPAGVTTSQITAVYVVGTKQSLGEGTAVATETSHLEVAGVSGIGGCTLDLDGAAGPIGPVPLPFSCQLTSSSWTNFASLTASASGATSPFQPGGTLNYSVFLEVHYTGSPVTEAGAQINLGSGFAWYPATETLDLVPFALYPISVINLLGLPLETEYTENLVYDGASPTDCATGGGSYMVWCESNGSFVYTGSPFDTGDFLTTTNTWTATQTFTDIDYTGYLLGPATAPTGACTPNGAWELTQDGYISVCRAGAWTLYSATGGGGSNVVNSQDAAGQTGTWTGASYTVPASGKYVAIAYIEENSGTSGATSQIKVNWTDENGAEQSTFNDTWTTFPSWDWTNPAFYATTGTTITPSVTVTGTVNYTIHYSLLALTPSGGSGGGTAGSSVTFDIATGIAASPATPYILAPSSGTVTGCHFITLTSDASANLVFNIKYNGSNILSGTSATVTAGAASGSIEAISLASGPLAITQGQLWELDITGGASDWTGAVQCY